MDVTRKFSRGGAPFLGGGKPLVRTSFIRLNPIQIKEKFKFQGGGQAHPPRDTHVTRLDGLPNS